jgi:hypothetical protein
MRTLPENESAPLAWRVAAAEGDVPLSVELAVTPLMEAPLFLTLTRTLTEPPRPVRRVGLSVALPMVGFLGLAASTGRVPAVKQKVRRAAVLRAAAANERFII